MSQAVDRRALRAAIRDYIETHAEPTWTATVNAVSEATDAEPRAVGRELDQLESAGFIYCVESADGEEVRLP
jgi:Fe2+ or Zn2+ uptake regulation protein